jgi:predicted amidohydrolase YtcJ
MPQGAARGYGRGCERAFVACACSRSALPGWLRRSSRGGLWPRRRATPPKAGPAHANKPREEPADIILYNGAIWTGDPAKPRISALAIRGETIVAAGTLHEMEPFDSPETRRIDLHGRFAMPGFNDAHVHLFDGGFAKIQINFEGTKSIAEFQQRIREHLTDYAAGEWITGQGWDHTLWEEKRFPTRDDLDAVAKDRPMYFERIDGHVAVANTKALQIARITAKTPDPPGGHIMHDPKTGEPNGMLEEDAAMNLVFQRIPPVTPEKWRRAVELGLADLAQHGVTSVQDYSPNTASKDPNALPETHRDLPATEEGREADRADFRVADLRSAGRAPGKIPPGNWNR